VIGPDNQAVELYDGGSTAAAIKDDVVNGPAGTYTVEVTNQDGQAASDFAISEQEKTVAAGDSGPNPQADSEAPTGDYRVRRALGAIPRRRAPRAAGGGLRG